MDKLILPIFVIDGRDVGVFASIEDVQLQLEAIDVQNQEYLAFDADGRSLQLAVREGQVRVSLGEERPSRRHDLETALRDFLTHMKEPAAQDPACDLRCLVATCHKFIHNPNSATNILTLGWWGKLFARFKK